MTFFFFFAITGWLTQVSCNQTQLESSLPCRLQQSARGRVYGADVCARHQPSHLFLAKRHAIYTAALPPSLNSTEGSESG